MTSALRYLGALALLAVAAWATPAHAQSFQTAMDNCTTQRAGSDNCVDYGPAACPGYGDAGWQICAMPISGWPNASTVYTYADPGCVAPEEWDTTEHQCVDKNQECLALNEQEGFDGVGNIARPFASRCMANGCNFGIKPGTSSMTATANGESITWGDFEWTGKCTTPTADAPETVAAPEALEPVCKDAGNGIKLCIKEDGSHCFTTSASGRASCYDKGETGIRTDGPATVIRAPGTQEPAAPTPKEGDTNTKVAGPTTTVTTQQPSNTTITTTTVIYNTDSGADAGDDNDGESMEGDDDEGGESGGGGDCDPANKPWFVGGDETLNMVATQTWATRCAVEAGKTAKVTGNIEDCSQTFTVEGESDNAHKLRAMRAQICPDGEPGDVAGQPESDEATVKAGIFGDGVTAGQDGLDDSGWGWSRTCPIIEPVEINGMSIAIPTDVFCDWMELGGQFVLLIAAFLSLRYMAQGV